MTFYFAFTNINTVYLYEVYTIVVSAKSDKKSNEILASRQGVNFFLEKPLLYIIGVLKLINKKNYSKNRKKQYRTH